MNAKVATEESEGSLRKAVFMGVALLGFAGGGAGEEEDAFAGVLGEGGGEFELSSGFVVAAEFTEEVGADAGEEVVSVEEGVGGESFYEVEGGLGAVDHGDSYGSVELDDRGWG